ncbi:hypothetical protein AKJ16_DCAP13279 [Drosera capensis]
MEDHKERDAPWLSVPQFGDWEQKGEVPNYSLDFSKIRETRKQNKREVSRTSLGNEEEFINPTAPANNTAASGGGYRLVQNNDTPTNSHIVSADRSDFMFRCKLLPGGASSVTSAAVQRLNGAGKHLVDQFGDFC